MNRRLLLIGLGVILAGLALTSGSALQSDGPSGCLDCHESLTAATPVEHPTVQDALASCLICHGATGAAPRFAWVIHDDHYASTSFGGDCWSCHEMASETSLGLIGVGDFSVETTEADAAALADYFASWASSELSDRAHAEASVTCALCHGTPVPTEIATDETCMACHGDYWSDLSELTEEIEPNPHQISHVGPLYCTECHGAHQESKNYCSDCH